MAIDPLTLTGAIHTQVPAAPDLYRLTVIGVDELSDVMRERDVFYIKALSAGASSLISGVASAPLSERDGFAEFTEKGRAEIDQFTNQVATDAVGDFAPLGNVPLAKQQRLREMRAETRRFADALKRANRAKKNEDGQSHSALTARPTTSQLLPIDFGDLDLA